MQRLGLSVAQHARRMQLCSGINGSSLTQASAQAGGIGNAAAVAAACSRAATTDALKGAEGLKVTAVLYSGGEYAEKEPRLLGTTENALGIREWLEERGHTLTTTDDKEGPDSELDRLLPDTDILITTPFWPAYVTRERLEKAPKLKMALTAGIGSDHVDLLAAADAGLTVAEVTGSNTVSVAEHVLMMILALVRNYMEGQRQVVNGEWNIAKVASQAFDLEGKVVGTVGAGRIGQLVLQRLAGFNCEELLYYDYAKMDPEREQQLGATYAEVEDLVSRCDVVTINCPLHEGTRGMFNRELIGKMKRGAFLVNTARGAIADTEAVKEALESGQLAGYAGDVWYPQPAPADHPWRHMPRQAMTPHYSGTTLDAQARYTAGVKDILERSFKGEKLRPADIIVEQGKLAPQYDKSAKAEARNLKHEPGWEKAAKRAAEKPDAKPVAEPLS